MTTAEIDVVERSAASTPTVLRSVARLPSGVSSSGTVSPILRVDATTEPVLRSVSAYGPPGPQGPAGAGSAQFNSTNKQGSAIVAGNPVATHSTGVGVVLANATDSGKVCIGLNMVAANDLAAVTVQTSGPFELDDWTDIIGSPNLAAKAVYFLSTTAGMLTTSSPTTNPNISQRVGKAVSPTTLDLDPWGFVQL